jgi:hypothetical protein
MELEVKRCAAPGMASAVRSGATSATANRDRDWETRAGIVELRIPKLRRPRRLAEKALARNDQN